MWMKRKSGKWREYTSCIHAIRRKVIGWNCRILRGSIACDWDIGNVCDAGENEEKRTKIKDQFQVPNYTVAQNNTNTSSLRDPRMFGVRNTLQIRLQKWMILLLMFFFWTVQAVPMQFKKSINWFRDWLESQLLHRILHLPHTHRYGIPKDLSIEQHAINNVLQISNFPEMPGRNPSSSTALPATTCMKISEFPPVAWQISVFIPIPIVDSVSVIASFLTLRVSFSLQSISFWNGGNIVLIRFYLTKFLYYSL